MGNKDNIFQLRYSDEESEMAKKVAANKGLNVSAWLRMMIHEEYNKLPKEKKP